jgi:DNA topoisomerase IB
VRLRRSAVDRPGITRRRAGRGFCYLDAEGNRVTDSGVLARVRNLAIPPAWQEVWICPHHNGHIQAIGTDEADRRQYLYHEGGLRRVIVLTDERLRTAVSALRRCRHGNPRLLLYRDSGGWHEIDAALINERFKQLVGDDYTIKDLRTWNATVHAAVALAGAATPTTKRATNAAIKAMLEEVSDHLGNTPTVARRSYVDPQVIEQFERGRAIERAVRRIGSDDLGRPQVRAALERSVVRLLTDRG